MTKILILAILFYVGDRNNKFLATSCMLIKCTVTYAQPLVHTTKCHKKIQFNHRYD